MKSTLFNVAFFVTAIFPCAAISVNAQGRSDAIQSFDLRRVEVTSPTFTHAQMLAKDYLLGLDADRLLAPYYKEAGLKPLAENYPNWENTGLDGHIGGHYVSALAYMFAATGDLRVKERLDYMVTHLAEAQDSDGCLSGVVGGHALWNEVFRKGDIRAGAFSLNDRWVPLYNIHKVMAGLRDAYAVGGNEQAKAVFLKLCNWFASGVESLSDEQVQKMLISEHGGVNEIMADAYNMSGERRYLVQARRLTHKAILTPLLNHQDQLDGFHANTQIPKVIGAEAIALADADKDWADAANFFWKRVTGARSVSIGGNSVREHFNPVADYSSMIESEQGPETCNTYNMLRLTKMLFLSSPSADYIDFYECAMLNHILSTINSVQGGFVYFTPMRPGHYRVYSQPQTSFWCCVGSGLENHSRYGEMIYAHDGAKTLFVNTFIPSRLNWVEAGASVEILGDFPWTEEAAIVVNSPRRNSFKLKVRKPAWAADGFRVSVGGETYDKVGADGYVDILRPWSGTDTIMVSLPMSLSLSRLPDGSDYASFVYGPMVLAADMGQDGQDGLYADASRGGHIAHGPKMPLDAAPCLVTNSEPLAHIHKDNGPMRWTVDCVKPQQYSDLRLVPFVNLSEHRYQIYFRVISPEKYDEQMKKIREAEAQRAQQEARTVDVVICGEQQPEAYHDFSQSSSRAGGDDDNRHWRETEGWFAYKMKVRDAKALSFSIYCEAGRSAEVMLDGHRIGVLPEGDGAQVIELPIPESKSDIAEIRIVALNGKMAPRVYEVRSLK